MRNKFFYLLLIIGLAVIFLFQIKSAEAFGLGFGGRISYFVPCTNGLLLYIAAPPPRGGLLMWQWGSITYSWYKLLPPSNVLGTYIPSGACVCPYGNCLAGAIPAMGTIIMVGSSAF